MTAILVSYIEHCLNEECMNNDFTLNIIFKTKYSEYKIVLDLNHSKIIQSEIVDSIIEKIKGDYVFEKEECITFTDERSYEKLLFKNEFMEIICDGDNISGTGHYTRFKIPIRHFKDEICQLLCYVKK